MMEYKAKAHPKVKRFLAKLPKEISSRIKNKLDLLKVDPFRFLEHYESGKCYKLRIGSYRALIDVDTSRKIVFVRVIDHRSRIYKR